jgi:hypothetical protein
MKLIVHLPYDENRDDVLYYVEELKELGLDIKTEFWHSFFPPHKYVFEIPDAGDSAEEIKGRFRDIMKDTKYPHNCEFRIE